MTDETSDTPDAGNDAAASDQPAIRPLSSAEFLRLKRLGQAGGAPAAGARPEEPTSSVTTDERDAPASPPQRPATAVSTRMVAPAPPVDDTTDPRRWTTYKRRTSFARRAGIVGVFLLVVVLAGWWTVSRYIDRQLHPVGPQGETELTLTIEDGWTTNDVVSELAAMDVVGNPTVFRYWMRDKDDAGYQAGDYIVYENMDAEDVLATLRAGPVVTPTSDINVVVREGLTLPEVRADITDQLPLMSPEEFDAALLSEQLRWEYISDELPFPTLEGLLFPSTYAVAQADADNELLLLSRMRDQFDAVASDLDLELKAAELGITPYQAVVVASLIEKEAFIDADRAKIAQVIYNRLDAGMNLGIDATTRYAVGKPPGEPLTQSDLASDSPYNTRNPAVIGLPPSPIASPGRASLEAALNPEDGDWLFYVLTNEDGVEGAHTFATTDAEFQQARQVCIDLDLGCG